MSAAAQNDCKTLWMGAIQSHWDEQFLFNLYVKTVQAGELLRVKLPRHPVTRFPLGYAFIEFRTHETACQVLENYNGKPIPGTFVVFRLNWGAGGREEPQEEEYSLFVGDLSPDVTEATLENAFRPLFPSCSIAKVITDPLTGQSKGFGFVRFTDKEECEQAKQKMNGVMIGSRPMRVGDATARKSQEARKGLPSTIQNGHSNILNGQYPVNKQGNMYMIGLQNSFSNMQVVDPNNSTVFVGNLDEAVDETMLRKHFETCGQIINVRIPPNKKGCGFVKFSTRQMAEQAISTMHGSQLGSSRIRLDWGKAGVGRSKSGVVPHQAGLNNTIMYLQQPQPAHAPGQIFHPAQPWPQPHQIRQHPAYYTFYGQHVYYGAPATLPPQQQHTAYMPQQQPTATHNLQAHQHQQHNLQHQLGLSPGPGAYPTMKYGMVSSPQLKPSTQYPEQNEVPLETSEIKEASEKANVAEFDQPLEEEPTSQNPEPYSANNSSSSSSDSINCQEEEPLKYPRVSSEIKKKAFKARSSSLSDPGAGYHS